MNEITLLDIKQINGENQLDIFKKTVIRSKITDFAVLLGGVIEECTDIDTIGNIGHYWTKTNYGNSLFSVDISVNYGYSYYWNRYNGIRAVVPYSKIKNDISNEIINEYGVKEVEYGEYPQYAVNKDLQEELEKLHKNNGLTETNKTYTTDSRKRDENDKDFLPQKHIEYEYNNKKYVRIMANLCYGVSTLSNGEEYKDDDYVWVEVLPIKWLIDEENDVALSKDILVAGVQFDNFDNKEEYIGNFKNTNMYKFLNTYFIKDIMPNKKDIKQEDNTIKRDNTIKLFEEYKEALLRYNDSIKKLDAIKIKYQEASKEYEDAKKAFEKIEEDLPTQLRKIKRRKNK